MATQKLFHRRPRPKGENSTKKLKRARESQVWGEVVELVGPSPEGAYFILVHPTPALESDEPDLMAPELVSGVHAFLQYSNSSKKRSAETLELPR